MSRKRQRNKSKAPQNQKKGGAMGINSPKRNERFKKRSQKERVHILEERISKNLRKVFRGARPHTDVSLATLLEGVPITYSEYDVSLAVNRLVARRKAFVAAGYPYHLCFALVSRSVRRGLHD